MFKTSTIFKRCLPSIFETTHVCIPKQIAIQIESITQKEVSGFTYKFEQKLMKEKERKKLASSILLLRKRSNHYHSIFAVFHAERNNILSQVQKSALSAN